MLLLVLLILDIGQIRIVQSDAYKAVDAGALAGANQSDFYEKIDYKEQRSREPVYKNGNVIGWEYVSDKIIANKNEWAEIREDDAKREVKRLFRANADQTTLTEDNTEILTIDSQLTEQDQIEVWTDLKIYHKYFPSFIESFYSEENLSNDIMIRRISHGKASPDQ